MRPDRDNIAAPDLPEEIAWIGEVPESMPVLTAGGPALVHFFDFAQLNSVRTLPYLVEWDRRYRDAGLSMIGVQAPRFPFGANPESVAAGLERSASTSRSRSTPGAGSGTPTAARAGRACSSGTGGALAWFHFGEGEYLGTEAGDPGGAARDGRAARRCPRRWSRCGQTDSAGARVMPPSPEVFPGGSWERPWTAGEDGDELVVPYEAGGAHATVEGRASWRSRSTAPRWRTDPDRRAGSPRPCRAPRATAATRSRCAPPPA